MQFYTNGSITKKGQREITWREQKKALKLGFLSFFNSKACEWVRKGTIIEVQAGAICGEFVKEDIEYEFKVVKGLEDGEWDSWISGKDDFNYNTDYNFFFKNKEEKLFPHLQTYQVIKTKDN